MTKNDLKLLILLVLLILITGVYAYSGFVQDGSMVQITVDGKSYKTASLADDQTITITSGDRKENVLVIENGYAKMMQADCPDRLCVHQKKIHKKGESIVCLPNRIVVTVISGASGEFDAIAQ